MKRTTILIPDDLDYRLRREARRRGSSLATVAREAMEAGLPEVPKLSFIGIAEGEPTDSQRVDEIVLAAILKKHEARGL